MRVLKAKDKSLAETMDKMQLLDDVKMEGIDEQILTDFYMGWMSSELCEGTNGSLRATYFNAYLVLVKLINAINE